MVKQHVNVEVKKGRTLHSLIFNGKIKEKDGRKKIFTKYHAGIAN